MRNRKLALAACLVAVAGLLAVPPAQAGPPWLPPGKSTHACGPATAGAMRCHALIRTDDRLNPLQTTGPAGYSPTDLRSAYNITASGTNTVAIIDAYAYPNAEADLATYRTQFGLPACTTANGCFRKLNQLGQPSPPARSSIGWSQEQALDVDMVSAICPTCRLILIEANSASFADLSTAVVTAGQLGVHSISNSYGGAESLSYGTYAARYNVPGVAVTASSGDGGYGVSFPASSPYAVAVGGTSLARATNPRGWSETVWNGAGSGCSAIYAKPSWQTDRGCARRTDNDVAAVADPNTGVAVYAPGSTGVSGWYVFGGTSVAAPIIAAAYAINGGTVTYASDIYAHPTDLYNVPAGSNGQCTPAYLCNGGVGYNGPTGLGTPNGTAAFGGSGLVLQP